MFSISSICLSGFQLSELKTGANRTFILKKQGQNHKVQRIEVKSQLDITAGVS
jgi:hypothetical protein